MAKPIIIVPYRDREAHLKQFIAHYKKHLPDVEVLVVEQYNKQPFNRGKLLNVGYDYANKKGDYWFIFHDVDMLYMGNDWSIYADYPVIPRHTATSCSQFGHRMPYDNYFGGVTMFNKHDFERVNGFSNSFNGWGCEDDDLFNRVKDCGLLIERVIGCRYQSLAHTRNVDKGLYNANFEKLQQRTFDGLKDLVYFATDVEKNKIKVQW